MSGSLVHSPADVIRYLLVSLGLGTQPSARGSWPIYVANEPDSPDSVITVQGTSGRQGGRLQVNGEIQEHQGIQIRVRDANHEDGYAKADTIKEVIDKSIRLNEVTIGSSVYLVWSVSRVGGIIELGKDVPDSKRDLFTLNAVVSLRQTT